MIRFEAPAELASAQSTIEPTFFDALLTDHESVYTVPVRLVDEAEMAAINHTYRQLNQPTDVLSFPLYHTIAELPHHDAVLGDLVICLAQVDEAHLGLRECLIHGTLHLLGFDHETAQKEWDAARARCGTPE